MKICDFTLPEIRFFLAECNFTKEERVLFEYRANDIPFDECAELMNISNSTVYRISKKMKRKIEKLTV